MGSTSPARWSRFASFALAAAGFNCVEALAHDVLIPKTPAPAGYRWNEPSDFGYRRAPHYGRTPLRLNQNIEVEGAQLRVRGGRWTVHLCGTLRTGAQVELEDCGCGVYQVLSRSPYFKNCDTESFEEDFSVCPVCCPQSGCSIVLQLCHASITVDCHGVVATCPTCPRQGPPCAMPPVWQTPCPPQAGHSHCGPGCTHCMPTICPPGHPCPPGHACLPGATVSFGPLPTHGAKVGIDASHSGADTGADIDATLKQLMEQQKRQMDESLARAKLLTEELNRNDAKVMSAKKNFEDLEKQLKARQPK